VKIRDIHVHKFRNHTQTDTAFGEGVNALLGQNGEGKTNLLEAISYLCLTKSFFGSTDGIVLQIGEERFEVSGELEGDAGIRYHVAVTYEHSEREKEFFINRARVEKFSDVVGQFPVVVLSPESGAITTGGPVDRRRFMDFVISQASKVYLEDLLEYRRVLRQRNRVLFDSRVSRTDATELLEPWNEELIDRGVRIVHRRHMFLAELQPLVAESYASIAGRIEEPMLKYEPSVETEEATSEEAIRRAYVKELKRKAGEEKRFGITLVGPHRDELVLLINNLGVRSHASQGQHKTFLVALKVAEFHYLQEKRKERPILLLDDIFTELDKHRAKRLLALTESVGQAFVTTTSEGVFPADFDWANANKRFVVRRGTVEHEGARVLTH
jgi:DNA replication and repair protein RecF